MPRPRTGSAIQVACRQCDLRWAVVAGARKRAMRLGEVWNCEAANQAAMSGPLLEIVVSRCGDRATAVSLRGANLTAVGLANGIAEEARVTRLASTDPVTGPIDGEEARDARCEPWTASASVPVSPAAVSSRRRMMTASQMSELPMTTWRLTARSARAAPIGTAAKSKTARVRLVGVLALGSVPPKGSCRN